MAHVTLFTLVFALVGFTPSHARFLGADFSKEELAAKGQIVKGQIPVHGYWVNWEDIFYYAGDTEAFNRFVEAYSKTPDAKLKVVLHTGTTKARSPWDKADRNIPADWYLYAWNTGGRGISPTRVEVWLGSKIKLEDLRIPANIEVVSGGEIERFITERKNPPPQNPLQNIKLIGKALTPDEAIRKAGKEPVSIEFSVGSVGVHFGPVRSGDDPRMPIVLEWDGRLKNGGRF